MHLEELKGEEVGNREEGKVFLGHGVIGEASLVMSDAKRALVGAGARALFYPTLLYNVVRNKMQAEFRWWDKVDEFILLGAVPFPVDVPRLKELGVRGVITLNESYETLVPTSLYHAHGIDHLVIPTRDYCFAPSLHDICSAVDFIHENALAGGVTYVHCKAGRGRSTTVVICYLVHHKLMTPSAAYDYIKSIRPRVLLASSQWQAVQEYYHVRVRRTFTYAPSANLLMKAPAAAAAAAAASLDLVTFDDRSVVVVTESDLDGYEPTLGREIWANVSLVYQVRVVGQAALARISCLWVRYGRHREVSTDNHLGGISVDIHVY